MPEGEVGTGHPVTHDRLPPVVELHDVEVEGFEIVDRCGRPGPSSMASKKAAIPRAPHAASPRLSDGPGAPTPVTCTRRRPRARGRSRSTTGEPRSSDRAHSCASSAPTRGAPVPSAPTSSTRPSAAARAPTALPLCACGVSLTASSAVRSRFGLPLMPTVVARQVASRPSGSTSSSVRGRDSASPKGCGRASDPLGTRAETAIHRDGLGVERCRDPDVAEVEDVEHEGSRSVSRVGQSRRRRVVAVEARQQRGGQRCRRHRPATLRRDRLAGVLEALVGGLEEPVVQPVLLVADGIDVGAEQHAVGMPRRPARRTRAAGVRARPCARRCRRGSSAQRRAAARPGRGLPPRIRRARR